MDAMPQVAPARTVDGSRLLIVDDDAAFGQRLARAMEKRGFVTEVAESAQDASAMSERNPPDFAVVDMRLGDGNGLEVVERIRRRHHRRSTPRPFRPC